jgi:hypothetical protein
MVVEEEDAVVLLLEVVALAVEVQVRSILL